MIKVTVDEEKITDDYPCLKINNESGTIVLFYDYGSGTVVETKNPLHKIGNHSHVWNEGNFTPFHGSVTLSDVK